MSGSEFNNSSNNNNNNMQKSQVGPPGHQVMQLSFGPVAGNDNGDGMNINIGMGMGPGDSSKKKRGRPRKYGPGPGPGPGPEGQVVSPPSVPFLSLPPQQPQPQQIQAHVQQQQMPPQQQMVQPQPKQIVQPPQQQQQQMPPHTQQQMPPQQQMLQPPQQQQQQMPPHAPQQMQMQPEQQQREEEEQRMPPRTEGQSQGGADGGASGSQSPSMKKRGRPPGSKNKHKFKQQRTQPQGQEFLGDLGIGFTPHVITVNTGEDISNRIMSFSQAGPRAICILSAIGAISNVTLRQAGTPGGFVTYEGRFEILSLSGSFMLSDNGVLHSRRGGLSVSLAGPDGRVLGGGVAGVLTAASPIQLVVGSFIEESQRDGKVGNVTEPVFSPPRNYAGSGAAGPSSPPSRGTLSESSGGGGSPLNQSTGAGAVNSTPLGMSNLQWK